MKFTANSDFREGRTLFEAGNTYDSAKHGLTEADLERFWSAGWAEVEGWAEAPERKPGAQTIRPKKHTVSNAGKED